MHLHRVPELRQSILTSVSASFPNDLCQFLHGDVDLSAPPPIEFQSRLIVGQDRVGIRLKQIVDHVYHQPTGQWALSLWSSEGKRIKVYRETKQGWFSVDKLSADVFRLILHTRELRRVRERDRRLRSTVDNLSKGLLGSLGLAETSNGPKIDITASYDALGLLTVTIDGVSVENTTKILKYLKNQGIAGLPTGNDHKTFWAHLEDEGFDIGPVSSPELTQAGSELRVTESDGTSFFDEGTGVIPGDPEE